MSILLRSLRLFFWTAYDHLGGLVLTNLVWAVLSLPWMGLAYLAIVLGFEGMSAGAYGFGIAMVLLGVEVLFLSPPTAGLFAISHIYATGGAAGLRAMVSGIRRHLWAAQGMGLGVMGCTAVLLLNVYFYGQLSGRLRVLGLILSGAMGSVLLLMAMVAAFLFPVRVSQQTGIRETFKYGVLLVLGSLPTAAGAVLLVFVLLVLGSLSGAGFFFGAVSAASLLLNIVVLEIVRKHRRALGVEDAEETDTKRSWRELIRPWET